eukprot:403377312
MNQIPQAQQQFSLETLLQLASQNMPQQQFNSLQGSNGGQTQGMNDSMALLNQLVQNSASAGQNQVSQNHQISQSSQLQHQPGQQLNQSQIQAALNPQLLNQGQNPQDFIQNLVQQHAQNQQVGQLPLNQANFPQNLMMNQPNLSQLQGSTNQGPQQQIGGQQSHMPQNFQGLGLPQNNDKQLIQPSNLQQPPVNQIQQLLGSLAQFNNLLALSQLAGLITNNQGAAQQTGIQNQLNQPQQIQEEEHFSKYFIGGILYTAKESDIEKYFRQYGHVVDVAIMRDKHTGKSRGFAFVTFKENNMESNRIIEVREGDGSKPPDSFLDKQAALQKERERERDRGGNSSRNDRSSTNQQSDRGVVNRRDDRGRDRDRDRDRNNRGDTARNDQQIDMKRKDRELQRLETQGVRDKVFVGGLDYQLTDEAFRAHFQQYGEVKDAQIVREPTTGASRGFGFITYFDDRVSKRLITDIQVTNMNGRKVDIRTAEPKLSEKIAIINKSVQGEDRRRNKNQHRDRRSRDRERDRDNQSRDRPRDRNNGMKFIRSRSRSNRESNRDRYRERDQKQSYEGGDQSFASNNSQNRNSQHEGSRRGDSREKRSSQKSQYNPEQNQQSYNIKKEQNDRESQHSSYSTNAYNQFDKGGHSTQIENSNSQNEVDFVQKSNQSNEEHSGF